MKKRFFALNEQSKYTLVPHSPSVASRQLKFACKLYTERSGVDPHRREPFGYLGSINTNSSINSNLNADSQFEFIAITFEGTPRHRAVGQRRGGR